ncbi:MAG: protein rep [Thermosphaera sp.]
MSVTKYEPERYEKERYLARLFDCGRSLAFLSGKSSFAEVINRLRSARFCRINICPICSWRKMLKWRSRLEAVTDKILLEYSRKGISVKFIFFTLTVKNCPISELRDTLQLMSASWSRLMETTHFRSSSILGVFRSLEVTRSKGGMAHPHYHCLMAVSSSYFNGSNYISQDLLCRLWQRAARLSYKPVCDIRKCTNKSGSKNSLKDAILEVCKYMVKGSHLLEDIDWTIKLADHLFRYRRFSSSGIFKSYLRDHEDDYIDLLKIKEEEIKEFLHDRSVRIFEWIRECQDYFQIFCFSESSEFDLQDENQVDDCNFEGV